MSEHGHVVVWIDHHQARIFQLAADGDGTRIRSSHPHQHLHHKANSIGSGHAPVDRTFLERVSHALLDSGAVLITGPSGAKDELAAHLARLHPELAARVSAVETVDHPTDGELLALARKFFRADDRMHTQTRRPPGSGAS
ncbi:MAG: translational machinery protein [Proteobacteria bacterium]|nr:translational machinery protein [Pseudomonadota bacterium]